MAIIGPKAGKQPVGAARLQRWSLIFLACKYELVSKKTEDHENGNALSRIPLQVREKNGSAPLAEQCVEITTKEITLLGVGKTASDSFNFVVHRHLLPSAEGAKCCSLSTFASDQYNLFSSQLVNV